MPQPPASPPFADLVRVSAQIGFTSFGGPAGQIALMHRELVDRRGWVKEEDFLHALNFCHLLPGPEAQQLATWIGWRLHGWRGGLVAGLLFVLPGAAIILGLSILYAYAAGLTWFAALFLGIKAAVLAIVAQALIRVAGRALKTQFHRTLAAVAFVGLLAFQLPFPLVVLAAGAGGMMVARWRPVWLGLQPAPAPMPTPAPRIAASLRTVAIGVALWGAPMVAILALLGPGHVLWDVGMFFSQLAVVTFGGAYAVLAYMAQEAVQSYGWLVPGEMVDGLGLAETTPGPLIMVTQFVGFLAAFRAPAPFAPLVAGMLGAAITTWVTFVPCFVWIFTLAPWMERLRHATALRGGLSAITAAVVGVIASLAVWFALHVLFEQIGTWAAGPVRVQLPVLTSFDWRGGAIAIAAGVALFCFDVAVWRVLIVAGLAGLMLA